MKIILVVHQFLPEYFAGTEILTFEVAKGLRKRGHSVTVLTAFPDETLLAEDERFDEYEIENIKVHRYHHSYAQATQRGSYIEHQYNNEISAKYFSALISELKPDVVHFLHLSRLGTSLIEVAIKHGIPGFITLTDFWMICPTSTLMLPTGKSCGGPMQNAGNCVKHLAQVTKLAKVSGVLDRIPDAFFEYASTLYKKNPQLNLPYRHEIVAAGNRRDINIQRLNALTKVISPTSLMTQVMVANGVHREKIVETGYGISVSGHGNARVRKRGDGVLTLGFIGTLSSHKGCHVLIEAFARLVGRYPVKLKIYGNPEEFPDYAASLKQAAVDFPEIEFCGVFPNSEIAAVLSGIDVLVVPSLWFENTPLVIHSALAARCPVVASNYPGMSEAVHHGENGLLFKPGSSEALAEQLQCLFDNPELLEKLSGNCKPPKSIGEHVEELLQIYASDSGSGPNLDVSP